MKRKKEQISCNFVSTAHSTVFDKILVIENFKTD